MVRKLELMGQKFNRLTVIERVENTKAGKARWKCLCDCGNITTVVSSDLKCGHIKSCGCLKEETTSKVHSTHGLSGDPIYVCWNNMNQRCSNPKATGYRYYGGRGIKVCEKWHDFTVFYDWAITHGYLPGLTIERVDVDGDYCPENCTWVPSSEQCNNTHQTRRITYDGRTQPLAAWARELGITPAALRYRLKVGWDMERIFIESPKKHPPIEYMGQKKSIKGWADEYGISYPTLVSRLKKGISIEEALTTPIHIEKSHNR